MRCSVANEAIRRTSACAGHGGDQGLAKALIAQSLVALKERGMTEAGLGVDAENISGALHLYEFMGYQVVKRSTIYRKAMDDSRLIV